MKLRFTWFNIVELVKYGGRWGMGGQVRVPMIELKEFKTCGPKYIRKHPRVAYLGTYRKITKKLK